MAVEMVSQKLIHWIPHSSCSAQWTMLQGITWTIPKR